MKEQLEYSSLQSELIALLRVENYVHKERLRVEADLEALRTKLRDKAAPSSNLK